MLCLSGFELYTRWVPLIILVVSGNSLEPQSLSSGGSGGAARGGGRRLPLLFVDQTEARRAKKRAPTLSQGLGDRPRPLSEGVEPPLL